MGQSFMKLTSAGKYEEKRTNVVICEMEKYYKLEIEGKCIEVEIEEPSQHNTNEIEEQSQHHTNEIELSTFADFYQCVSKAAEKMNKRLGNTQFKVPDTYTLRQAYERHQSGKRALTRKGFQEMLKEVIKDTGITGMGAKNILYIFGVPFTALFIKQRLLPAPSIPNENFIPGITSLTVFVLAMLNKI